MLQIIKNVPNTWNSNIKNLSRYILTSSTTIPSPPNHKNRPVNLPLIQHFQENVKMFVQDARQYLNALPSLLTQIENCEFSYRFSIPFQRESGEVEHLWAYRTRHSLHVKPCKGGVKYATTVNRQEIEGLSELMTYKLALARIPWMGRRNSIR